MRRHSQRPSRRSVMQPKVQPEVQHRAAMPPAPLARLGRAGLLATTALCGLWSAALAQPAPNTLPANGTVTAGQSTIAANGNAMVITQGTQRSAINWNSYSIGANASVTYVQPSASAISLNRVTGNDPSQIFGRLTANGQVWLSNPNGILFGRSARVDVAGLVAATSNISDHDFMNGNGRFTFSQPGRPGAAVVNQGEITVREAGLAALVAPGVVNDGTINARLGRVALGGGSTFTLDLYGDQLVNLQLPATQNAVAADGTPVGAGVTNSGRIMTDGGRVELTANVARGVVDNVIRMSGTIEARAARVVGGTIVLDGGSGGVEVTGTLDVSGRAAGQRGGRVQVTGERIRIAPTVTVDAAGDAGGGTIEIGGGYRGTGPLPHAQSVSVEAGARLIADALTNGRGGTVVVWSDGDTTFNGAASARGGALGGDGGLIETSGHNLSVGASASIDASAPNGARGMWLLDPTTLEFKTGGAGSIGGAGAQEVDPSVVVAALDGTNVTATATVSITVTDIIDASGNTNPGSLFLEAPTITVAADIILKSGSDLGINATGAFMATGIFNSNGAGFLNAPGGNITIHQNAGGLIQDAIDALNNYASATVVVGPGTFFENVVIYKPNVELRGARADQDPTGLYPGPSYTPSHTPATETVIAADDPSLPAVWIMASDVTINGFSITGSNQGSYAAGIRVGFPDGMDGFDNVIRNTRILNNYITENSNGIVFRAVEYGCECDTYVTLFENTIIDRNRIQANNVTNLIEVSDGQALYGPLDHVGNGILFEGNTSQTLITRNYIVGNNADGIRFAGYGEVNEYSYPYRHELIAIVGNLIQNPGYAGVRLQGELTGVAILFNTISGAFACAGDASTCTFSVPGGEGFVPASYSYDAFFGIGDRGAVTIENAFINPLSVLSEYGPFPQYAYEETVFASEFFAQALSLTGLGITAPDIGEAFFGGKYNNSGYVPSVIVSYNLLSGRGYGVSLINTRTFDPFGKKSYGASQQVECDSWCGPPQGASVYVTNNHLAGNTLGGLFFGKSSIRTTSIGTTEIFFGFKQCEYLDCTAPRVIAAGNFWNGDPDTVLYGPTFTQAPYPFPEGQPGIQGEDDVAQRVDIRGSEAFNVIVSAWRIDGTNQMPLLNAQINALIQPLVPGNIGSVSLPVSPQVGYLPTNTVRVGPQEVARPNGDEMRLWSNFDIVNVEAIEFQANPGDRILVFRGPGAWDPSGRITRALSVIRDPLAATGDNGIVDVMPGREVVEGDGGALSYRFAAGYYSCEGGGVTCLNQFTGSDDRFNGIVFVDKNNVTIQAHFYGVDTPTVPAGLIPGTPPPLAYNPDAQPCAIALDCRAFDDSDAERTRLGSQEVVVTGGFAIVPNLVRGALAGLIQGESAPNFIYTPFGELPYDPAAAATNNVTLSGLTIVNGFDPNRAYLRTVPFDFLYNFNGPAYPGDMRVGVLVGSGTGHVIRNNIICASIDNCSARDLTLDILIPDSEPPEFKPFYGDSIGILISDRVQQFYAEVLGYIPAEEGGFPVETGVGSNTQILQNDIIGWNTAGIQIGDLFISEPVSVQGGYLGVSQATGVEIRRNAIVDTGALFVCNDCETSINVIAGGTAILIAEGAAVTITNNWIRNNISGVVTYSPDTVINENQFISDIGTLAISYTGAVGSISGINNWIDFGGEGANPLAEQQVTENFINNQPAPDRFDHNPLLPGWQIFVEPPPTPTETTVTFPTFDRIPVDQPNNFIADPFLLLLSLGGGGGQGLGEIAPAAGGQGGQAQECTAEQVANAFLGGAALGNPGGYQQIVQCRVLPAVQ